MSFKRSAALCVAVMVISAGALGFAAVEKARRDYGFGGELAAFRAVGAGRAEYEFMGSGGALELQISPEAMSTVQKLAVLIPAPLRLAAQLYSAMAQSVWASS